MSGRASGVIRDRARAAQFDERLSLLGLPIDAVNEEMRRAVETGNAILENLRGLKQVKTELNRAGASYVIVLYKHLDAERTALRLGQKANSIKASVFNKKSPPGFA